MAAQMKHVLPQTLKFKLGFYVAIALTWALLTFVLVIVNHERKALLEAAEEHVTQISQVITKSTRFAMLQNQPNYVARILQDVANQESIYKVRLLSKEGRIIHSTHEDEVGLRVDRKAEACVLCHRGDTPLAQLPTGKRTWTFTATDGRRLLGSMEVIRNEPSCYNAACHQHSPSTAVLGVLDILYSLDDIDRAQRQSAYTMAGLSAGFVLLASLLISLFVHKLLYRPLRDLESGAKRLAAGNLEESIPIRSADEFGELAASFNAMTRALRNSQDELREWGRTLEEKVERRTHELRIAEAEAARGEKLASVGLLAAGIAHELNSPLTGILTFAHLLRQKTPDGSPDAEDLDLVIRETKRCAAIIRRLLDFAREKKPEKNYADLNALIAETVRLVERPAHLRDIEITLSLAGELPPVWIDADLIKQVLMNLLVNAQHAIEEQGSITVQTARAGARPPEPGAAPVDMVSFSVIDTGCGIPEQNMQRIFDPFFTSKDVGKGTGLGLSVSHGIIKAHGGDIEVQSRVGEGSTFRVYLPVDPLPENGNSAAAGDQA